MKFIPVLFLAFISMPLWAQLAPEPTAQPTNFRKQGNDFAYQFDVMFDVSTADGFLVLRSKDPIIATPVDGTAYEKGEGLGNAKVFSTTVSSFLRIGEVEANTDYYFAIYAYNIDNNDPSTINYLTTSPLTATITSAGAEPGTYYSGIDFSSSFLVSNLTDLINPHTMVPYSQFDETLVANFFQRDTVGGQHVINCQYSHEYTIYTGTFGYNAQGYNREHRMPFSWINFNGISRSAFENTPEGSDLHALELVQQDVNTQRLNYPFSSDIVSSSYTHFEFTQGRDSRNKDVAEVRDDRKGDVARALFYMMLCYNGKYSQNWGLDNLLSDAPNQELSQLLTWSAQDPPDGFEIARNEYVYSQQGNRNPFIDYPGLEDCIDFTNMTVKAGCTVGVARKPETGAQVSVYPLPASNIVSFSIDNVLLAGPANIQVTDLSGRVVYTAKLNQSYFSIDVSDLTSGFYLYTLQADGQLLSGKLLVDH